MFKIVSILFASIVISFLFSNELTAQTEVIQDYSNVLDIPNIKTIEASAAHLYVLSETEGMIVFRSYSDSLQWLYTSSGMQRRGNEIDADIRFAYLYGDSKRLTVLEPTSVLGVYSSTLLPSKPLGVARLRNDLFIALGSEGLGKLSLQTPETVDTDADIIANDVIERANVLDVASSVTSEQLFVLTDDARVHVFRYQEEKFENTSTVLLNTQIHSLFLGGDLIWGATENGDIFEVNIKGLGKKIGAISEPVESILLWKEHLIVRGESGRVWLSQNNSSLELWKKAVPAKNFIAKSGSSVWMASYNKLSPLKILSQSGQSSTNESQSFSFKLKPISNTILTYPKPLLLGIEFEGNYPLEDVELSYRSNAKNASIKKQGLYWQPNVNQIGLNWFTIIATNSKGDIDSTRFTIDVRTFNAPPRFSPIRKTVIGINEAYEVTFKAVDPENPSSTLIRYLGVDLPEGSSLNENSGLFSWTPSERNVGETTFRIIATDEQGAATSQNVVISVLNITREGQ